MNRNAVLFLRLAPTAVFALSVFDGACANFPLRSGEAPTTPAQVPATLVAERRLRYAVPGPVVVTAAPGTTVPQTYEIELWQGVRSYMAQVGLEVVADPAQPHDADVQIAMNILGTSILMRGSASLQVMSGADVVDRVTTPEEIEPPAGFGKSMARELVERLVHSAALAAFADARSGVPPSMAGAGPGPGSSGSRATPATPGPAVETASLVAPAGGAAPSSMSAGVAPGSAAAVAGAPPAPTLPPVALEAGPDRVAAAKAQSRQGSAYYDVGRYAEAFAAFEQAYLIEQDPALLYNMGQCQRKLGNVDEAVHFYRTYLRRAPRGPSAADADKRIRELEAEAPAKAKK